MLALAPSQVQKHCHLNTHPEELRAGQDDVDRLLPSTSGYSRWTDLSTLGKGKGKKGKGEKKVKGKGEGKKGESNKDEKDKDEDKNGKGKANAKTTKHFLGYSLVCKAWEAREEGLLVECQEREGHCISGDPTTPAPSTTEPPITGMLLQSDEGAAQWLYSPTKREPSREEFLIDS